VNSLGAGDELPVPDAGAVEVTKLGKVEGAKDIREPRGASGSRQPQLLQFWARRGSGVGDLTLPRLRVSAQTRAEAQHVRIDAVDRPHRAKQ